MSRLLPPALAWRLERPAREKRELAAFSEFYRTFVKPGDLCFDIGANLGNRVRCFLHLGCTVVAVEPQSWCFARLQRRFGKNPRTVLIHKALGRQAGQAEIHISRDHVLSSLSTGFIERTRASGRFSRSSWDLTETCELGTLDQLIAAHGKPAFIKIDVEGYESEVLQGLSQPVAALSIEWIPEFPENTVACLRHLGQLGDYEFNLSWGESMRFSRPKWRDCDSMLALIGEFEGETQLFGDIYARLRGGQSC